MRWLAFVLFASVAFAQSDVDAELAKAAKSPYDLVKFIERGEEFHFADLWRALGAPNDAQDRECSEESGKYPQCHAKVIPVGDQAIVWVSLERFDHYIRFTRDRERWKFAGKIDDFQKYYKAHQSVLSIGGKPFFLVTSQGDSGTGIASQIEDWYDLSLPKLKPALSLVKRYAFFPLGGIGCEARTEIVSTEPGPPERIHVKYTAKYESYGILGRRQQDVVYTRIGDKFIVDNRSPTSQRELDRLYGFDDDEPSREEYLRWFTPRFRQIAAGPKAEQRDWLVRFLGQCKDPPEKRELLRLMKPR